MSKNNQSLQKAAKAKADEFYTLLSDIEAELRHYKDHFKGKRILCNCDDPFESNFFKYFAMNFNYLGLAKLTATSYVGSSIAEGQLSLFEVQGLSVKREEGKRPYKIEITEVKDEDGNEAIDLGDVVYLLKNRRNALTLLEGDGDFRSQESINLLKDADIVVTNPPFSLFRTYMTQLIESGVKFLIIGNQNAVSYKDIFPLFQEDKLWLGYNSGHMEFKVPDHYESRAVGYREENGIKYRSFGNICWFTNLDINKHHEPMTLYCRYDPEKYPRYVNYDAIEVSKTAEIPYDYDGEMGVPITYLDKHNPDQFEIVGASIFVGKPMSQFAAKGTYMAGGVRFYLKNKDGTYQRLYDRIVIKRKVIN